MAVKYGTTNRLTGGSVAVSSTESGLYPGSYAFDGNTGTSWRPADGAPQWIRYDCGSGVEWVFGKFAVVQVSSTYRIVNFSIEGSNNGTSFTTLYSGSYPANTSWNYFYDEDNETAYRYLRFYISSISGGANCGINEFRAYEILPAKSAGFFAFFCESWQRHDKLWRNNKLVLPKDLGFSY